MPHLGLPFTWVLEAKGKISRLDEYPRSRWEFSQKNGEQERNNMGESVFSKTDPIFFIFRFAYILFVIHRDEYRVMWGSVDLTLVTIRCFI